MNSDTIPCGAMQALDAFERNQEAAEVRQAQAEAAWPLEDFEADAWDHAFDETGYELLTSMAYDIPYTVLQILLLGAEVNSPNALPEISAEYAKRTVRVYIGDWIRREQIRLQAERIKDSR